jgi:WD40 repeat protein
MSSLFVSNPRLQAAALHFLIRFLDPFQVIIYDSVLRKIKKTITRFRDIAYSGSFRPDGQLVVAGGETGIVQVFDPGSRAVLRQLKGHTR